MIMRGLEVLQDVLYRHNLLVTTNEPLARHTWYRIGGPADLFVVVETTEQLRVAVTAAREHDVPFFILGGGSNLLVADKGIRGVVIANRCGDYRFAETRLITASGAGLREVARGAVERGLAGLEWAVDIPGTVGGAVVGNAGAFGGYICDVARGVTVLDKDGAVREIAAEACGFEYRHSKFKGRRNGREVLLTIAVELYFGDKNFLAEQAAEYTKRRAETQPSEPSAGSVFKRTAQYPAGFLIEQAGLKGTRRGDALISPKHANFIVNLGAARACDVKALLDLAQERVWAEFGEKLVREIELVGEWD